jgi:hypothetical protein
MRTEDRRTSARETERLQPGRPRKAATSSAEGATPEGRPRRVYSSPTVARHPAPPVVSLQRSGSVRALATGQWAAAAGLLGLLGGCAPEEELPLPPVVWEGESVRVRMDDPEIEVCGGSFEALDRHAELVREALLLEGDGVIEYSIGDQDFVDAACEGALVDSPFACTTIASGHVFTRYPFIPHEVVHGARRLDPELGHLSSAFEEGLATLFGSDPEGGGTVPLEALETFEDDHVVGAEEYYRSGQLMAILLDSYDTETFRDFDVLAGASDEEVAFTDIFGDTKEAFAEIAESVPHCEQSQWWMPLLECDAALIPADSQTGALMLEGNVSCGRTDVQGPEYGRMWTSRHFRLDERTSTLSYRFDMPEDATLEIVGCSGGCPERFVYSGTRNDVGTVLNGLPALEPGEYFLRISRPVANDDDGHFQVVLQ